MRDDLGDRMKSYEAATRFVLPPRTYTIIRVDGKNFHSFTRNFDKPFDPGLINAMQDVAIVMMKEISGSLFAYTQSDEVSIVLQDFAKHNTQPWVGGVVQKQASIAASMATATFAQWVERLRMGSNFPLFDGRTYTIPDAAEVMNYLIWRQQDATRNSINMVASTFFSHKSLHGLSSNERQEKLFSEEGINWNDYRTKEKRGSAVYRETFVGPITYTDKRTQELITLEDVKQSQLKVDDEIPIFTTEEGREYLANILCQ